MHASSDDSWWRSFEARLLLGALLLRLLYLSTILDNPFFQHPITDERQYDLWARAILAGEQFVPHYPYYEMPLHAFFLAGVYRIFGSEDLLYVRLVQVVLGTLNVAILYRLARRLFDEPTARVAGLLAAAYLPFLYYEGLLLKESVAVFLVNAALLLFVGALARPTPLGFWSGGVVLGLVALTRANALVLPPALLLAMWLHGRPAAAGRRLVAAVALLLGLAMAIAPATIRNKLESGEWVLLTVYGGQNLYTANNPANTVGDYLPVPFVNPTALAERVDFHRRAEALTGREMTPTEVSAYWKWRSLEFSFTHPSEQIQMIGRRFLRFWNYQEVPDNHSHEMFKRFSWVLRLPLPAYWLIAPFALVGMLLLRRRWLALSPLYFALSAYLLSMLPFWIMSRYRLPIVGILILFAAAGMVELHRRARTAGSLAASGQPAMGLAAACLFCWLPLTPPSAQELEHNLANGYVQAGRYAEAIALYEDLRKANPNPYTEVFLADALGRAGRVEEAFVLFKRLAAPDQPPGIRQRAYNFWGDLGRRAKQWAVAERAYRQAIALDRGDFGAWNNLALVLIGQERDAEAEEALQEAIRQAPEDSVARRNLEALHQQGRVPARGQPASAGARP